MSLEIVTKALDEHGQAVKSALDAQGELSARMTAIEQHVVGMDHRGTGTFGASDIAHTVATHDMLNALRTGGTKSVLIPASESVAMLRKAVVGDVGTSNDTPFNVQPQRAGGIFNDPRRTLRAMDLLPRIEVGSNTFEFIALDGFQNGADYQVAEGDTKAEQPLPTELKSTSIATIAVTLPASEQVLQDVPQLQGFLNGKLISGVLEKLEREVIAGAGGLGKILGLTGQATDFAANSGAVPADAIGQAVTELQANGWNPGLILLNPHDWFAIASERAEVGNGQYVLGSPRDPASPALWGVPVVTTPSLTAGTALVLDPQQVALLDRMAPRFAIGLVDSQFIQNMLTMRAELRAGLAVFAPSAVLKLSI